MWRADVALPLCFASAAAAVGLGACESPRERPTGTAGPPPTISVAVIVPEMDDVVPSDSTARVVIEARGPMVALEALMVRSALADTLDRQRRAFDGPVESAVEEFALRVPKLTTGVHLEIRGVAEDPSGGRHLSDPVVVTVIECDVFPLACE
jgi:hypothetical protein